MPARLSESLVQGSDRMKEQDIIEEDWDNLIILDACRYDFFERVYKDYLAGGQP